MTSSGEVLAWPQQGCDSAKTASTEVRWSGQLTPSRRGRRLAGAASPAVVVGRDSAYVTSHGTLVVRDHRTGRQRWEADLLFGREWYEPERPAPTIAGGVVCVRSSDEQELLGFALDTGEPLWSAYTEATMQGPPTVAGNLLVTGDVSGRCYAIDGMRGSVRWSKRVADDISRQVAIAGDTAFVPSRDGFVYAVDLASGKVRWPAVTDASASVTVSDDIVLAAAGDRLIAIDPRLGERLWRHRLASWVDGEPATRGGAVVVSARSTVHAAAVGDGRPLWDRELGAELTSPSIAGDVVFVASQEPALLQALSLRDGDLLWSVELPGPTLGAPVVTRDGVLLTVNGAVEVFRFEYGRA